MTSAQALQFDPLIERFWSNIVKEDGLDNHRRSQLHLPTRHGGFAAGSVEVRADAAFLTGSVGALDEMKHGEST